MDCKNLEESGNLTVKRKPGRPRKIQSHNLKAEEEMVNSSNEKVPSSGNSPEFFKIYMPALCSTMLRISPDFIENFRGNVPTTCTLKRPWGGSWKVDVNRMNDCWFFQKGWPQFVEQNSVEERDFLTFCYLGKSVFLVKVFSTNGCMKGYVHASNTDDETSESDNSEEINEIKPRKVSVLSPNGCAKGSGHASKTDDETSESELSEETNGSKMQKVSRWGSSVGEIDGNPCFSIEMYKTYIQNGTMSVPLEFWNAHMSEHQSTKMATLCVENDTWSLGLMTAPDRVMFRGGNKFIRDNSLKVRDSCTFQLIDSDSLAFKVTFRRK